MKISVSLSPTDLEALDRFVAQEELGSRSAGIQRAIRILPDPGLSSAYAQAFTEWSDSPDESAWDVTAEDGIRDAPR